MAHRLSTNLERIGLRLSRHNLRCQAAETARAWIDFWKGGSLPASEWERWKAPLEFRFNVRFCLRSEYAAVWYKVCKSLHTLYHRQIGE